jgi:hypothetical protein
MNKLVLAAAAALGATALTASAAVPAAGDAKAHTKRFVESNIAEHSLSEHTFAGAAVDRHAGHIIGYDTFTAHLYPRRDRVTIWVAYAFKNGTISAVAHAEPSTGTFFPGRILNGTGRYKGIQGTITARPFPHNADKTHITLTYHF